LKGFYQGLSKARYLWHTKNDEDDVLMEEHFIIGRLVDALLTEPEEIERKFIISEEVPTKAYSSLIEEVVRLINIQTTLPKEEEELEKFFENYLDSIILEARRNLNYYPTRKDDTIIKMVRESGVEFIKLYSKCKTQGKTLCTPEQVMQSKYLAQQLQNSKLTGKFLKNNNAGFFHQTEVYWQDEELPPIKSKLDNVVVIDDTIYFTDIKTYHGNFLESYYKGKLYLQASLYITPFLLYEKYYKKYRLPIFEGDEDGPMLIDIPGEGKKILELIRSPEYKIYPYFIFLTVDKSGANPPLPYRVSIQELIKFRGIINVIRKDYGSSIFLPGWEEKAKELYYHIKTGEWEYPLEVSNTNFISL